MNERLKNLIETYMIRAGKNAALKLAGEAGCGVRMIYAIKNEGRVPKPAVTYRIVKACGVTEDEALRMSQESASTPARDTA